MWISKFQVSNSWSCLQTGPNASGSPDSFILICRLYGDCCTCSACNRFCFLPIDSHLPSTCHPNLANVHRHSCILDRTQCKDKKRKDQLIWLFMWAFTDMEFMITSVCLCKAEGEWKEGHTLRSCMCCRNERNFRNVPLEAGRKANQKTGLSEPRKIAVGNESYLYSKSPTVSH